MSSYQEKNDKAFPKATNANEDTEQAFEPIKAGMVE